MESLQNYHAGERKRVRSINVGSRKRIPWLTALFCASIITISLQFWPISLGAADISAVMLALYAFISLQFAFYIFYFGKVRFPSFLLANMLVFLTTIPMSLLGRTEGLEGITFILRFMFLFSIPIILVTNLDSRFKVETALDIVVLAISIVVLMGFTRSVIEGQGFWTLTNAPKVRNLHTFIAETGFLFAIWYVVYKARPPSLFRSLIYPLAAAICGSAIVFSLSRGAWVAVLIGISGVLLLDSQRKIIFRLGAFTISAALLGSIILFVAPDLQQVRQNLLSRAETLSQLGSLQSDKYRLMYQLASLEQISSHPFRGIGAGRYGQVVDTGNYGIPKYVANVDLGNAHNSYFQVWAEQGILAFLAILFIVGWPILKGLQRLRGDKDWLTMAAVSFLVSSGVHLGFEAFYRSFPFWVGYGLAITAIIYSPRNSRKEK